MHCSLARSGGVSTAAGGRCRSAGRSGAAAHGPLAPAPHAALLAGACCRLCRRPAGAAAHGHGRRAPGACGGFYRLAHPGGTAVGAPGQPHGTGGITATAACAAGSLPGLAPAGGRLIWCAPAGPACPAGAGPPAPARHLPGKQVGATPGAYHSCDRAHTFARNAAAAVAAIKEHTRCN